MKQGKEQRITGMSLAPIWRYLPDQDRYYTARPEAKYRFNVIGVGNNGREHIRVTHMEGRATVHGIYDPNPRSIMTAKEEHARFSSDELVVYDSLEAACNDPAVDGLIICTPNYTHIDVVKVAVKSGKHILLEKPSATTVPDAHTIVEIAEEYRAVFQIGLQYRYKAIYTEAIHEAFERGSIGEVKSVSILEHRVPFLDKVNQWNKFAKFTGDTLVEKCCHYFDLLNLFAGARPVSVYGSGNMAVNFKEFEYNGEKSDILDNAMVVVNYANGVRANFNLCMFAPMFYEELIVTGDEGWMKASERKDFLAYGKDGLELEVLRREDKVSRIMTPQYQRAIQQSGHHGATYFEHVDFINEIDGKESGAATASDGFWAIVVAAAAQESIKTGQVVQIDDFLRQQGLSELAST